MTTPIVATRRHKLYTERVEPWKRSLDAYRGGRRYITRALIRHLAEIDIEFDERLERASYFNYPRKIARLITQYALATDPVRNNASQDIVEDFDRSGRRANEVMRQASTLLNVCGCCWLYVSMPGFAGEVNMERKNLERLRPFCRALKPTAVVDWCDGDDGRLLWAIIEDEYIENRDPMKPAANVRYRVLWTREAWTVYRMGSGSSAPETGVNPTGKVPLIKIEEPDGFGLDAGHWFEDVVRITDAIFNNESEAQMNIIKQMFGMLVVPDTFARSATAQRLPAGSPEAKLSLSAMVARSAAIMESADEKGISRYIAPNGIENSTIREDNARLKQELFDAVGLAIQSQSTEAQTAESKAWDFQNISQFLASRADMLEQAEAAAWEMMRLWDGSITVPQIVYNRQFATVDFANAMTALVQASTLPNIGIEYQKHIARAGFALISRVMPPSEEQERAVRDEIDGMQPAPVPEYDFGAAGNGNAGNIDNPNPNKQEDDNL